MNLSTGSFCHGPPGSSVVCCYHVLRDKIMFSFIKKVVTSALPWGSDPSLGNLEDDELTILNNIKSLNIEGKGSLAEATTGNKPFGQSDPVQYEVGSLKLVRKTGKVTHLCSDYGLIDDVVYFEPNQIAVNLNLKLNDQVWYSAFKVRENEAERVYKLYALKEEPEGFTDFPEASLTSDATSGPEEISVFDRVVTGRVTKRKGREVYIESADIWCNLDKIKVSYIPVEGDWVELQAVVKVDEEEDNLSGDVLEVRSLRPLLTRTGSGRVTFWSEGRREGAIENLIYFTCIACEAGYAPTLGDEVLYSAVESDQERYRWRALRVGMKSGEQEERAMEEAKEREEKRSAEGVRTEEEEEKGIWVRPALCVVEVELNEVKRVVVEVRNGGAREQLVERAGFEGGDGGGQVRLVSPRGGAAEIRPEETVEFVFECEGKFLGLSEEVFRFHFKNFVIARRFEVQVTVNRDMSKLLECKFGTVVRSFEKPCVRVEREPEMVLYGPKPWKPPKFISRERKCIFNIPKKLRALADGGIRRDSKSVLRYAPYLAKDLSFAHYSERFHTLLYLEEMELRDNFRKYDMKGVFLQRRAEYFVVEVEGLVEKRPSLITGDKVSLTQAWSEDGETKHVGFIHEIHEKEVFLKFHQSFHEVYDGSECELTFEPNTSFFSKAHDAVDRAVRVLGEQWLFPSAVNEKPVQVEVKVGVGAGGDGGGTLKWVNKDLNERQKLAVLSVVRGQGRPLPYIIFGPPGTGKTITLVEIIVQIYRLFPDSRILVTTPSNSSADLISERLVSAANFKPGQLVRLYALHRVQDGLVPTKLIPYSTYHSGRESAKKGGREGLLAAPMQVRESSLNEVTGRHRITVATCAAIGALHYHGLSPGHFTHILVDEAGQTSEPEVLLSNVQKCQVVLTGDPQQLGPVVFSGVAKTFGLGVSLMQRLTARFPYARDLDGFPDTSGYDPRFITKLNLNYRSLPEILSLPSQMFYNSDLVATVSQTESEEAAVVKKFDFRGEGRATPAAIIFQGILGQNYQESDSPSWFNPHEIWQVVFLVKKLYSIGLNSDQIGIVTPYAKQVQKLKKLMPKLNLSMPKIGSVEEFQGQERLVIILSTVRSSPKLLNTDILHSMGFVASPQRLNVALTRARALLIIVGNPLLLSTDPYWASVVKYCRHNNSYSGCKLPALDDKPDG